MTSFYEKLKVLLYQLREKLIFFIVQHFVLFRFINMKTGRMLFITSVVFFEIVLIVECSMVTENQDVIRTLTDTIHRSEAATEAKRNEEMERMVQENNDLCKNIHR